MNSRICDEIANGILIKGAAFETSLAQQTSIVFGYSGVANEDWLALYGCGDWDYASRECNSGWIELNSTTDRISNTVTFGTTIFYPAYVVVEMLHCGNSVCETNLSETCANCPQDCGACPIPPGGGRTDVSRIEELLQEQKKNISQLEESISEMKKKLNTTTSSKDVEELKAKIEEQTKLLQEMGEILKRPPGSEYVVPPGQSITTELYPGETIKRKIRVRNVYDYDTIVTANVTGELARILAVDNPRINISAGGESELNITILVPYDFEPRAIY